PRRIKELERRLALFELPQQVYGSVFRQRRFVPVFEQRTFGEESLLQQSMHEESDLKILSISSNHSNLSLKSSLDKPEEINENFRYFLASEQQRYEHEYGSICQLDRENSGEYMERFTRLASFVGAAAGDAQRQARHFKWGLKKWVLDQIVNTDYTNIAQVAAVARKIELLHESGNSNKRDRDGSSGQRRSTETLPPLPLCATCGKPHPGVCYKATRGCFTCGSTQHKVKDFPQGKQKQSMSTDLARLPPTTGRVYATTRGQASKTSGTITGILCIDDRTVFSLFDIGAMHSIISTTFAKKLNMTPTPLIERIIIST
nr:zinc finger, CCHC-type, retrotransposon Gag domain protein [Tanacetum cinerariifolium]